MKCKEKKSQTHIHTHILNFDCIISKTAFLYLTVSFPISFFLSLSLIPYSVWLQCTLTLNNFRNKTTKGNRKFNSNKRSVSFGSPMSTLGTRPWICNCASHSCRQMLRDQTSILNWLLVSFAYKTVSIHRIPVERMNRI